ASAPASGSPTPSTPSGPATAARPRPSPPRRPVRAGDAPAAALRATFGSPPQPTKETWRTPARGPHYSADAATPRRNRIMATAPPRTVLTHLPRIAGPPAAGTLTDRDLLRRFAARRDQAAFAALVERHGPLVLGVGRRVLGHAPDVEDVFQATFL